MRNSKQTIIIFITILTAFFITGCGSKDLSRSEAESKLTKLLPSKGELTFNASSEALGFPLAGKPEFVSLNNLRYGALRVVVSGIRKKSESEAVAEWHLEVNGDRAGIRKVLDAYDTAEKRLAALHSGKHVTKSYHEFFGPTIISNFWEFTDPSDGQVITVTAPNIKQTNEWQRFQQSKLSWQNKAEEKGPTRETKFLKYDDGWRIEGAQ